jgi:ABC-2 type transport system permease protein
MLDNTFLKTIYEKRWSLLAWSIAIALMTIFVVVLFPTFKDSFGQSLKDVPDSLKSLIGEAADYQRISGFISLQVIAQMVFITVIYGVILGSGLVAGDENEGTLQSLLAQPVSRSGVYIQKLLACAAILGLACLAMAASILLGVLLIGESVSIVRVLEASFATWLITLVFGWLAYALGAILGRRGIAGAFAGGIAFLTYLVTTLAGGVKPLQKLNYGSPFKYFNTPTVMDHGLQAGNVIVLSVICLVLAVVGYMVFIKRDINQR